MCKMYSSERPKLGAARTITVAGEFSRERLGRFSVSCPQPVLVSDAQGATEAPVGAQATLEGLFDEFSCSVNTTLTALDRITCTAPHPGQDARSPIRTLNRNVLSERYLRSAILATLDTAPAILVKMTA